MNQIPQPPSPLMPQLASPSIPSFADLVAACEADQDLGANRRRDVKSALVTFCRLLHRQPEETFASAEHIRRYVEGHHPLQLGASVKRWQNILTEIRFALDRYGPQKFRRIKLRNLTPCWLALSKSIAHRHLRHGLSRLIKFCSVSGIEPENVDVSTIESFETYLSHVELNKQPGKVARRAAKCWNNACRDVPGWSGKPIVIVPARDAYCLPWESINDDFRGAVDDLLRRLGIDSWDDENAPLRPLRPSTLTTRRFQLRQCYSILVRLGHDGVAIRNLAYLVELDHARAILNFLWERSGGKPNSQTAQMAHTLLAIARHDVGADKVTIEGLGRLQARAQPRHHGLVERNRTMLQQFDDAANIEKLLLLPFTLAQEAKALVDQGKPYKAALLMQTAVAIEILIMMPLRLGNLVALDMDIHFNWRGKLLVISIPPESVKNRVPIEFTLEDESLDLLRLYLAEYRPLLANGTSYLFPGAKPGRHKVKEMIAKQVTQELQRHTGLKVTVQQYRHVAARIWLDENPGSYGTIQRVLLHRSMATTSGRYVGLETRKASEHYERLIWKLRLRFRKVKG